MNEQQNSELPRLTSWFTFGQGHIHKRDNFFYDKDVVVKITARCPREEMMRLFGREWAFEYSKQPNLIYFPRGVKEFDL